jgi:hypothetical protein
MRNNYSLSSQELNDKLYSHYRDLVYLSGFENQDTGVVYSGVYDKISASGAMYLEDTSIGIPHLGNKVNTIGTSIDTTSINLISLLEARYIIDRAIE